MSADTRVLLEAAEEVCRVAGGVAHRYYGSGVAVEAKGDGSPVTIADRSAELAARDWIMSRYSRDGILGEELPPHQPGAPRQWVIDPIDGTSTFLSGVPLWGTLVAVCEGTAVLAGAAFFPAVGEMLAAAPGEGCWWNGVRTTVSAVRDIADASVLTTDERFPHHPEYRQRWRRLATAARLSRSWGDCYGYLLVATGRAEVMTDPVISTWDVAALQPAITEAGGVFTDWKGQATAFGGNAIATNRGVGQAARALLGVPDLV